MTHPMTVLFRLTYAGAAALSLAAGALTVASLFIADRAPHSMEFLGVSLAVGAFFLILGMLLFGIRRHVSAIGSLVDRKAAGASKLAHHVDRLAAYLLTGGALLCVLLGVLTYAILARIDQGFAVFG